MKVSKVERNKILHAITNILEATVQQMVSNSLNYKRVQIGLTYKQVEDFTGFTISQIQNCEKPDKRTSAAKFFILFYYYFVVNNGGDDEMFLKRLIFNINGAIKKARGLVEAVQNFDDDLIPLTSLDFFSDSVSSLKDLDKAIHYDLYKKDKAIAPANYRDKLAFKITHSLSNLNVENLRRVEGFIDGMNKR